MRAKRTDKTQAAIVLRLPIRTVNALNVREHWSKRSRRSKKERQTAWGALIEWFQARSMILVGDSLPPRRVWIGRADDPLAVTLTREAPRSMDQGCGLNASLKAVRDGVADALGVNDNDPRVTWEYAQRKAKEYAVVIEIRSAA